MTRCAPSELARPRSFKVGLRLALLLGATLLVCEPQASRAQPPARITPSRINAARLRWFQYKLVAGRLLATSAYPEGMNISFGPSTTDTKRREHLQLLILEDRASIRYELTGEGEELSIELAESGAFSIRRARRDPPLSLDFTQPPEGAMTLVIERDGQRQEVAGPSFWHLYLAAPELVSEELVPYLETLRPAWQLIATGQQLERNLIQRAQQHATHRPERWRHLVERLASGNFAEREEAQRDLAASGQAVLPFLEELDPDQLDPEQASRVQRLITNLRVNYEDTADRVANWLIGDIGVWLSLATRPELAKREVAKKQLSMLVGEELELDPAATEEIRAAQLARVRRRYLAAPTAGGGSVPPPALER